MAGNANSGRKAGFKHLENTRQKIRTSNIITHMQNDLFSKNPHLTDGQIKIGFGLLRKVLPDLQGITLSGDPDHPMVMHITEEIIDPKK